MDALPSDAVHPSAEPPQDLAQEGSARDGDRSRHDDAALPGTDGSERRPPKPVRELREVDHDLYHAVAHSQTPTLDATMAGLSNAANKSVLWFGIASGLAVTGARGRRAAANGLVGIALASATVNLLIKPAMSRDRPNRSSSHPRHASGRVHLPASTSFPSGHSASAFAFAGGVAAAIPAVSLPVHMLAGSVAYSRVYNGVHYPADVAVGSFIGIALGDVAPGVVRRLRRIRLRGD